MSAFEPCKVRPIMLTFVCGHKRESRSMFDLLEHTKREFWINLEAFCDVCKTKQRIVDIDKVPKERKEEIDYAV